jgi:hypothetical protein
MQNRLDVRSVTKVTNLSRWCQHNLSDEDWTLEVLSLFPCHYKFEFTDPRMSTMAALNS